MFAILKYIKLILWSGIYYSQEEKSDIVYKVIIKNIKDSGCVLIKFIQWLLPKIEALTASYKTPRSLHSFSTML